MLKLSGERWREMISIKGRSEGIDTKGLRGYALGRTTTLYPSKNKVDHQAMVDLFYCKNSGR